MGKKIKKYNIEDLYDIDMNDFIKIFRVDPHNSDEDAYLYGSKFFYNLPEEEQLELFEVYLLKYFYYIYINDLRNVTAQIGTGSFLDEYFSEVSVNIPSSSTDPDVKIDTDFVLTMEFYEPRKNPEHSKIEIKERVAGEFTLWTLNNITDEKSSVCIRVAVDTVTAGSLGATGKKLSKDLFEILGIVYEQLVQEEELYAWYLLNGINLKHILLQDGATYDKWEGLIEFS